MKSQTEWAKDMGQFCGEYGPTGGMAIRVGEIQKDVLETVMPHLIWGGKGDRKHCRLCGAMGHGRVEHKEGCLLR
jgi:hypothetical protein